MVVAMPPPAGSEKSTVPPALRVMAPRLTLTIPPLPLMATSEDAPALTVRPLNRCVFTAAALPWIVNVPPPSARAELVERLLTILLPGAPTAEKSSERVPALTTVGPA